MDLRDRIIEAINTYQRYLWIKEALQQGISQQKIKYFKLWENGFLVYQGKAYVPNSSEMKNVVIRQMHNVPYFGHSGYHKFIAAMRSQYFFPRMKKEVDNYIARCL
jgi:hypothetical protein